MGTKPVQRVLFICVASLAFPFLLLSQSASYITGKIINSKTSEAVPFATIVLKKSSLGVFANAEGDFKIIRNPEFQSDSLIVTCIGFKRFAVFFKTLADNKVNRILLVPADYALNEVKVVASRKRLDAEAIIAKAIRNIKKNYPQKPYSFVSYYRDYQKKDSLYLNLNEAIIQTNDNGFSTRSADNKYRLLDFRNNTDFPRLELPQLYGNYSSPDPNNDNKYIPGATLSDQGGNELLILMVHDAIRNFNVKSFSFINIFSRDFVSNHIFSEIVTVFNNNLALYKISFKAIPRLTSDTLKLYGDIYIQAKDFSIQKLDYYGTYIRNGNVKKEMFNVKIEYGYEYAIDTLVHLRYISFNNIFRAIDPADIDYFRITKSYLDQSNPSLKTLVFEFNNKINKESAEKKDHYKISFGGTIAKIKNIYAGDSIVIVRLENDNQQKGSKLTSGQCLVSVQNIKDVKGRTLDDRKYLEYYQYRELFVQEYDKPVPFTDNCKMENKPLLQNCISKYSGEKKYWMNTPINVKPVK